MSLKAKDIFVRVGKQSDLTTVAGSLIDIAIPADGDGLSSDLATETLDTEHGSNGVLYTAVNSRNGEQKSFQSYLFPNIAALLLDNVLSRDASGDQDFLTVESHWGEKIASGQIRGQRKYGVVFDGFSLNIDRTGAGQSIVMDFPAWLNRKQNIPNGESTPTPDFSDVLPYSTTGVKVDFVLDGALENYGGHNTDVRSISLTYANQGEVEEFQDNDSNVELDKSWTIHTPGEQQVSIEVTVSITDEKYLELEENEEPAQGKLRVAFTHPKAFSVTSTSTVTSGVVATQTILVADTTGLVNGDVVIIEHPTAGFAVMPIENVVADTSFDIDTSASGFDARVTMDGSSGGPLTIRNMAQVLTFDRIDYRNTGPVVRQGNKRVVTLTYEAALMAGASSIIEHHAYDHLDAHV